jgi:5-methylthioadenosine/S-adenosylhomocysteine deaminase
VDATRERFADCGRVQVSYCPHTAYTTSPESLAESRELARTRREIWQVHCSENEAEIEACLELHGKRPVALLEEMGLLGPGTVLHHCVEVTEGEIALHAATGTGVVHCPESNMKLGCGQAPVRRMIRAGLAPALGTDGAASNNNLNLFGEMRRAALLQKVRGMDPTALPAQAALDMATVNGARLLGIGGEEGLAPGAPADLIALDLAAPNLMPLHNPVCQVVYAACGGEVRLNMVAGRILFRDGEFVTLDREALIREADQARAWVLGRLAG